MQRNTHIAFGIASTLTFSNLVLHSERVELFATIAIGGISGIIPDVDIPASEKNEKQKKNQLRNILIAFVLLVLFNVINLNQINQIDAKIIISSLVIFILCMLFCTKQRHRDFSHSICAMLIFTFSFYIINPNMGILFIIGFLSHVCLDILNQSKIQLFKFTPLFKDGVCLNIIKSDNHIANIVITVISIVFIILQIIYYLENKEMIKYNL